MIDWKSRTHELGEAEKDLAFALVKLQSGEHASAFLNTAIALGRMSRHLAQRDWDLVDGCLRGLGLKGLSE